MKERDTDLLHLWVYSGRCHFRPDTVMDIYVPVIKKPSFVKCTPNVRHYLTFGGALSLTKFSTDEKLQTVIRYRKGSESLKRIAKSIGVHFSVLANWIKQYEHHGEEAFKKRYTPYSVQDKLDVLQYMNEHGTSIRETAAIFNIASHSTILSWQKSLEVKGIDALQPKIKGRSPMKKGPKERKNQTLVEGSEKALQAEVEFLRMENAYLKKLNALVQNKEKSPKKTRLK